MMSNVKIPGKDNSLSDSKSIADELVVKAIQENERDYILKVLDKCNGKLVELVELLSF